MPVQPCPFSMYWKCSELHLNGIPAGLKSPVASCPMTMAALQQQLTTEAELAARLATGGCKIVEVYSEWSGPCKSILPTIKKLRLEGKDEEMLAFLVIPAEAGAQQEQLKEHRGKSEPLFLVFRNGTLKSKVHGANIPELLERVAEWVTPLPGLDDLEENPFFAKGEKDGAAGKDGKRDSRAGSKKK